jgi:hypothetical protein
MRQFRTPRPESGITVWVDSDGRTNAEIARALAVDGWLKVNVEDLDGETWWETTTKGNALAQASFGRPITRATAQRHLAAVVDRAQTFNSNGTYLIDIAELLVFGSYLDPDATTLGDLDLAVAFRSRIPESTPDEHTEMLLAYARASGLRFDTFIDRLFWPQQRGAADTSQPVGSHQHHARERTQPHRPVGDRVSRRRADLLT